MGRESQSVLTENSSPLPLAQEHQSVRFVLLTLFSGVLFVRFGAVLVSSSTRFFVCTLTERLNVSHRQRKDELEQRMSSLQESRRELMVQLEGLMKLLKVMNAAGPPFYPLVGWRSAPPAAACVCPLPWFSLSLSLTVTLPDFSLSILFLSLCFCPCCGPVG